MARPRQVTDEQILSTMRGCVLRHGPAVSLEVVAEQLSVTSPALLKRFGTRRQLLIAALKPAADGAWTRLLERGPDDRPLKDQLEQVLGEFSAFFLQAMPCLIALRESGIPHRELYRADEVPPPVRAIRALSRWLGQARQRGLVESAALETAATALVGAVTTRAWAAHLTHSPWSARAQREYVEQVAALFSRALAPDPRHQPTP